MGLPKGRTNNLAGRKFGTPNKITSSMRHNINNFLAENWEQVQADFKALEPKERLIFYEKLLSYGLPKLQSTTLTTDFEKMTDEQLDYTIQTLLGNGTQTEN